MEVKQIVAEIKEKMDQRGGLKHISILELTQLDSGKSMIRYLPPKGTAGFAVFSVRTIRRLP